MLSSSHRCVSDRDCRVRRRSPQEQLSSPASSSFTVRHLSALLFLRPAPRFVLNLQQMENKNTLMEKLLSNEKPSLYEEMHLIARIHKPKLRNPIFMMVPRVSYPFIELTAPEVPAPEVPAPEVPAPEVPAPEIAPNGQGRKEWMEAFRDKAVNVEKPPPVEPVDSILLPPGGPPPGGPPPGGPPPGGPPPGGPEDPTLIPNGTHYVACAVVSGTEDIPCDLVGGNSSNFLLLKAKTEAIASILSKELVHKRLEILGPSFKESVKNFLPSFGTCCFWMGIVGLYFLGKKMDSFNAWLKGYTNDWASAGHPPLLTISPRVALFK